MRAVLFDMDGVIVNSEDDWVTIQRSEILPAAVPDETVAVEETSGMNYREIYDYLEAEYGTAISRADFEARFTDAAEAIYTERVDVLEGFEELLAGLDARDVAVALVSSAPHDWIDMVLDRFDLEDAFDAVVSGEDVDGGSKPEPDVFEYGAAVLGVAPEECVIVEDSANGILAGARAGSYVVAYRIPAHGDIDREPADVIVDTPAELRAAVLAPFD